MLKESNTDRIVADLQSALNEDANFNGVSATLRASIEPPSSQYEDASKAVVASLGLTAKDEAAQFAALAANVRKARVANATLWNASAGELKGLPRQQLVALETRARPRGSGSISRNGGGSRKEANGKSGALYANGTKRKGRAASIAEVQSQRQLGRGHHPVREDWNVRRFLAPRTSQ